MDKSIKNPNIKDEISEDEIKKYLQDDFFTFEIFEEVTSTNLLLKEKAQTGEKEGKVIIASSQKNGRGRLGRSFYSPKKSGIYLSILLKPNFSVDDVTLITPATALAVCKAIENISNNKINPQIKWVNDILVDDKKVCGILTESGLSVKDTLNYAIVGVGLNIYEPRNGFPDDIKDIAGAIFKEKQEDLKNRFIAEFLNSFLEIYKTLPNKDFVKDYKSKLNILNKEIYVISRDRKEKAKVLDLLDDCRLLVKFFDGREETLNSGEISIRKD